MKEEAGMIRIAIATLALTMIAVPVLAQAGDTRVRTVAETARDAPMILSQDEIVALAKDNGVSRISNIGFENDVWRIDGATRKGEPMRIDITATGEVLTHTS
jgi:hypothetical protein